MIGQGGVDGEHEAWTSVDSRGVLGSSFWPFAHAAGGVPPTDFDRWQHLMPAEPPVDTCSH